MEINQERYRLYQKKAVLEAHIKALEERIYKMESNFPDDVLEADEDDFDGIWSALDAGGAQ